MENSIEKSLINLLKDYKKTIHPDLKKDFGIEISIYKHIQDGIDHIYYAVDLLQQRFFYKIDYLQGLIDCPLCKKDIEMALILHDIIELEDKEATENGYKEMFSKYNIDYRSIDKDVITMILNHEINLESEQELENFFSTKDEDLNFKFLIFLISHDIGIYSNEDVYINSENEELHYVSPSIIKNLIFLKYNLAFDVLERLFYKEETEKNKDFTAKLIVLNNDYFKNNIQTVAETITSADVGGGVYPVGDARHSNLFGVPIRRFPFYKGNKKRKRKNEKEEIIDSKTFNKILMAKMKDEK